jgi:dipeptidyl aminopeptidase/acylaminoacyl peptidase
MRQQLRRQVVSVMCVVAFAVAWAGLPVGAQAPAKRPISYDTMDYWRAIGNPQRLSDDGQWLAYALSSQGEDGELIVRNLASGKEFKHPRGTTPQFTPDAKFLLFTIVPPKTSADDDAAGRAGGAAAEPAEGAAATAAARNSAGIMALPSGQVTVVEQISTIRLAEDSSTWVALHKGRAPAAGGRGGRGGAGGGRAGGGGRGGGAAATTEPPAAATTPAATTGAAQGATPATPAEKRKDAGSDLIIRNLATGADVTISEVNEFAWNKGGSWLAYAVSSTDAAKDGAFVRQMSDGAVRTLHTGKGHYKSFAFDEGGAQLAFLSDQAEYDKPVSPYRVYYWKSGETTAAELVSGATRGMPQGMVVHDSAPPRRFSEDGKQLFLNTAPPPAPPADPNAKRPTNVDLWNYKDAQLQPMQRVRATQDRNRSYRAVVHLGDKRFVQLATPDMPSVNPGTNPDRAIGTSDLPYQQLVSWDQGYNDVYLVDLKNGQRRKLMEKTTQTPALSPGGAYLTYFDEFTGHWYSYRIADGTKVNLTERLPVKFFDEDHDTPDMPGPYAALGGWTAGDKSLLLYDQFDIWEIRPDGTNARMITAGEGRKQRIVFRWSRALDPELLTVPTTGPVLLSATNDTTKATGFYRTTLASTTAPEKVVMLDKAFGVPTKAKNADRLVFTLSRFEEFPNLWTSDANFAGMQKVTDANPQQAEYVWGTSELVEYINADGVKLRAILTKPEGFDPSKQYPMMVYIYEGLTQGLHRYVAPNVGTSVNVTRYVSNGYVVLQPDIIYNTGYPGEDAEKCVIPAVNTIVAKGFIDPKRIGIQGHSWGGYQITHLITRTNLFAAVQAGASVSNMISAYGGIRWGTGMSRAFQYEKTQSRIGAPPWSSPLQFIENSPIFWVEKIQTPYLTIHNDADDAVPWYQGIEFFSAMRRLGKEAYFFNYNGELHGLRNRDNMKHWTVHQDEFFDHYLLGKPKPAWMDKGVPFLERGTRDVSGMFKRAVPAPAGGK